MFLTLLITISLFDIYDLLIPGQHNHKCLPKSKENLILKGGQFESAGGGQFAPARTDFYVGTEVVNLDRQTLVKWNGLSSMSTTRRKFSKEFKAKVVLEALKERETLESLAKKYELQPTQISLWKTQAMSNFPALFSSDKPKDKENDVDVQQLYAQIGKLQVQNDFLKKKLQ